MEGLPYETIGRVAVYAGAVLGVLLILAGVALQVFFFYNDRKLFWSYWLRYIAMSLIGVVGVVIFQVVFRDG